MFSRAAILSILILTACEGAPERAFFAAGGAADETGDPADPGLPFAERKTTLAEDNEAESLLYARDLSRETIELETPGTRRYREAMARVERFSVEACEFLTGEALAAEVRALLDLWRQRKPLSAADFQNLTILVNSLEIGGQLTAALAILAMAEEWIKESDRPVLTALKRRLEGHNELLDLAGATIERGDQDWKPGNSKKSGTLLLVVSSECRTCVSYERAVATVRGAHADDIDVVVLIVGPDAARVAKRYESDYPLRPVAVFADSNAAGGPAARYGLRRLPAIYLLDRQGTLRGGLSRVSLESRVGDWLEGDLRPAPEVATSRSTDRERR
jgi:hypothetical protein